MYPTREEALALLAGHSIYYIVEKDSYRPSM